MRSLYVWLGVSALCTLLGAGLLGQRVFGQPDPQSQTQWGSPAPSGGPGGYAIPVKGTMDSTEPMAVQIAPAPVEAPSALPPLQTPPMNPPMPPMPPTQLPPGPSFPPGPQFPSTLGPDAGRFNTTFPQLPSHNAGYGPAAVFPTQSNVLPPSDVRTGRNESVVTTEFVGPATSVAKLGQPMSCQIIVRNTGTAAVHQVVVRHQLPEAVEQRGCEPAAIVDGRLLSWNLGTLDAGQTRKIHLQLVALQRGPLNCAATVTFSNSSAMQVQVREPRLAIKIKGPEQVVTGEEAVFQITLSNPGDGLTENITLDARLSEGLDHPNGRKLKLMLQSLAPGETRTMPLQCTARGSGRQSVELAAAAETNLKAVDSSLVEVLVPRLDLAVSGPRLRYIDRHAVYSLKISNPGSVPASGVMLTEVIPAGFKFVQASGHGELDREKHAVVWNVGDLMPGQTREVTLDLLAASAGDHRLVGLVNSARGIKTEAEVRTRVEGVSRIDVDVADTEDPVEVGSETTYQIRIANRGSKTESNIQVLCQLPEQMEFVKANMRHHVEGRTVVFEPIASLAPGVAATGDIIFSVTAKGTQPGNLRVRVQVRADSLSEPIIRDEVTRFYSDDVPAR